MEFTLPAALILGLTSGIHCVGMCGSIIGTLTLSLPAEVRDRRERLVLYVMAYNVGRIASYAIAGAVVGALGHGLFTAVSPQSGHLLLQGVATLFMVAVGLYLAGWFPRFAAVETVGRPLWRRLEPLGRRLVPVASPGAALLYGAIWGWLPCGLVYTALTFTVSAGSAGDGALYMLAFGAGTLPAVVTAGLLTDIMVKLRRQQWLRQGLGILIIALALISFWMVVQGVHPPGHEMHHGM